MFQDLSWGAHGLLYVGALSPSLPATSLSGHDVRKEEKLISPIKHQQNRMRFN